MHTGIISFANRIVFNIKSNDIKDIILNQLESLYNIKIIQKHFHKLDETNIKYVNVNPHLCTLRTNGNPYYMFFTLYNDIPIIYFIDKKIHPGYQKPRIILLRGLFNESLYKNTLIDGEMVKCKDGKWIFMMNDIIAYEGEFLIKKQLPDRLKILYNLLEYKYTPDSTIDVCSFKIKTYYELYLESINNLIKIATSELNYTCRGIYIWSYNLKFKPKLYNFDENNIINVVRKVKDETEFKLDTGVGILAGVSEIPREVQVISIIENNEKEKQFWISKTDEPDVYNLYDNESCNNKIGNALVSSLMTSKMLRNAFKNKNAATILKCVCEFNEKFKKWLPTKLL